MRSLKKILRGPIVPVLFSAILGPGTGQILNGEFKKGFLLMITTFGSFMWFSKVVGERLSLVLPGTPDEWKLDPTKLTEAFTNLVHESPSMFLLFQILMILLWIYGMLDAYWGAKERRRPPPAVSASL
jgi:hypothetical protein